MTHEPDTQPGAMVGCECSCCREARLNDDDRIIHTARDVVRAYAEGWRDGAKKLTTMRKSDIMRRAEQDSWSHSAPLTGTCRSRSG